MDSKILEKKEKKTYLNTLYIIQSDGINSVLVQVLLVCFCRIFYVIYVKSESVDENILCSIY